MPRQLSGRLELTWMGKELALIPSSRGAYDYDWVSPTDPRACQTHYLIYDGHVGDTEDGGIHDNLLISGESGDVLEALVRVPELAKKYVGQVKCIYIDPPFNTEKTFEHYEDNLEHSVWLTMMRDRLVLMKKLLATDGSIWVHLNHSENHRMRALLDEVFGAQHFLGEVVWQKADSPRNDFPRPSDDHDIILAYRSSEQWVMNRLERPASMNVRFTSPDNDPEPWFDADPTAPSAYRNQTWVYAIQHPVTGKLIYPSSGRCWFAEPQTIYRAMSEYADYELRDIGDDERRAECATVSRDSILPGVKALMLAKPLTESAASARERIARGNWPEVVIRGNGTGGFGRKARIPTRGVVPSTWWPNTAVGHNREAKAEVKELFTETRPFATPKPERLLERVLTIATNPGDLVLDCFAGSGTTAAVAHKLGRRWLTCELLSDTVDRYTRPRLERVVRGEDPGGVTKKERLELPETLELPNGLEAEDARNAARIIRKVSKEREMLTDLSAEVRKAVRTDGKSEQPALDTAERRDLLRLLKKLGPIEADLVGKATRELLSEINPRTIKTTQWAGGGGFDVAHLSPPWVEVDDSNEFGPMMYTTAEATGEVLARSIAAHLGFHYLPDDPRFCGTKGRQVLALVEGLVTHAKAEELDHALEAGKTITVACFGADEGVHERLREHRRGSRIIVIPEDLFNVNMEATR